MDRLLPEFFDRQDMSKSCIFVIIPIFVLTFVFIQGEKKKKERKYPICCVL